MRSLYNGMARCLASLKTFEQWQLRCFDHNRSYVYIGAHFSGCGVNVYVSFCLLTVRCYLKTCCFVSM